MGGDRNPYGCWYCGSTKHTTDGHEPKRVIEIKEEIHRQVEEYARKNVVGRVSTEETLAAVDSLVRQRYAEMLGWPVEQVSLLNLRYEDDDETLVWDGIDLKVGQNEELKSLLTEWATKCWSVSFVSDELRRKTEKALGLPKMRLPGGRHD